ncbi:Flp family type IVb pilin [Alteraurantiacibacter buctensis]|uniref:Flp family type IVb pilin n=1 Tax=Alteraurantiacibacter buctensis TaxID=1503981 RepID=A0A844YZQ7_9SPHN|nr:Flp family type IVb pilin [Alteraurantiacibacter buctensis]MXO71567.1 Flp family type IVb pilin [Alteraurantiacibacter buctensis]
MIFFRKSFWRRLAQDTRGVTGIEYGLIASLIAMAALTGMDTLGAGVQAKFEGVDSKVSAAVQ